MENLVRRRPARAWVLLSCGAETQEWFARSGLPTLLLGHRHHGIELPCIDADYFGVSQHAARMLLAKGHHHLAMVRPVPDSAGDRLSEQGFLDAARNGSAPVILTCGDGRPAVETAIRRLKSLFPRPTGVFVCGTELVIAFCSHAAQAGLRIPQDVSLIARDSDPALERFSPDISRYLETSAAESRKLCGLIRDLATNGAIRPSQHLIPPRFYRGETVQQLL